MVSFQCVNIQKYIQKPDESTFFGYKPEICEKKAISYNTIAFHCSQPRTKSRKKKRKSRLNILIQINVYF